MWYSNLSSYSVYHIKNIIRIWNIKKKWWIQNYDTTRYYNELENRKLRSLDKWWENWYHYETSKWKWFRIDKKRKARLKERYKDLNLNFKLLDN